MSSRDDTKEFFEGLTVKQREVLEFLADNRTSKEIAGALDVSESAVNQRIDTLRQRFGGITRSELARRYRSLHDGARPAQTCEKLTGENLHLAGSTNHKYGSRSTALRGGSTSRMPSS